MSIIVNSVEFDFSDSQGELPISEQKLISDRFIGREYQNTGPDAEEEIVDEITDAAGYCVISISFTQDT